MLAIERYRIYFEFVKLNQHAGEELIYDEENMRIHKSVHYQDIINDIFATPLAQSAAHRQSPRQLFRYPSQQKVPQRSQNAISMVSLQAFNRSALQNDQQHETVVRFIISPAATTNRICRTPYMKS